ncbi:MAG: hypothetical protein AABW49_00525 [Nanoarchaeota archaeon]
MTKREEKEIVYLGKNPILLNPDDYDHNIRYPFNDFIEKVIQQPSLGFIAHQRLNAALRMFGSEITNGVRKWNWMGDLVNMPGHPAGDKALFGIDEAGRSVMEWLTEASIDKEQRAKMFLFVGPPGDGKTTIIENMAKALDAYGTLPEGAYHTIEVDLSGREELFGGINKLILPCHESPLRFLSIEEYKTLQDKLNPKIQTSWQQLRPLRELSSPARWVINTLKQSGLTREEIIGRLTAVRLFHDGPDHCIKKTHYEPVPEKDFDSEEIFGGELYLPNVKIFSSTHHPLVYNYGIAGNFNGPNAQGAMAHFSELLKREDTIINQFLDLIQEGSVAFKGRSAPLDTVLFATSNLEDHREKTENPSFSGYLRRRLVEQLVRYIIRLDDITNALENTAFSKNQLRDMHVPPHFIREILGVTSIISTLEPSESLKFLDKDKEKKAEEVLGASLEKLMLIYNCETPQGDERDVEALRRELIRHTTEKPLEQQIQGVKIGVNFSFFGEMRRRLRSHAESSEAPERFQDKNYNSCVGNIVNLRSLLEDIVNRYPAINEKTRERILKEALPLAWSRFRKAQAIDVFDVYLGEEGSVVRGAKYLAMIHATTVSKDSNYIDPITQQDVQVDKEFLDKIHKHVRNKDEFIKFFSEGVRHRCGTEFPDVTKLSEWYIRNNREFRSIIEGYILECVLPSQIDGSSTPYSPENIELTNKLIELKGYCHSCAPLAIMAAAENRRIKKNNST